MDQIGKEQRAKQTLDGIEVLNLPKYTSYYLTTIYNKLTSSASKIYRDKFGIGIVSWRIMAVLAATPKLSASEVGQIIGIDKGAISKNIRDLIDLEFVTYVDFDENRRKKHLMLTDRGYQLHDEILPIALERENILLSGLKEWEIHFMFEVLNKMLPNLKEL